MKPDNVTGSPLNPQNWNLYSYVRGNPVNMNDPTGHSAATLAGLAQRVLGGPEVPNGEGENTPQGDTPQTTNDPPESPTAVLLTDMTNGQTTLMINNPGNGVNWVQYSIPTSTGVVQRSQPGAQNGFITNDVEGQNRPQTPGFGSEGAYIETNDPRGRDIHGGGSNLADPYAADQPLTNTLGCTRGHNSDVQALGNMINDFKATTGETVPYVRFGTPPDATHQNYTIPTNSPFVQSVLSGRLIINPAIWNSGP